MIPIIFPILIIGSVILMVLWELRPTIERKVIPVIMKILSVPGEVPTTPLIYLSESPLLNEYSILVKQAEKTLCLGFPIITKEPFTNLLRFVSPSVTTRIILTNRDDAAQIREIANLLKKDVEIIYRPRIHFKLLFTEQRLAIGSANFSTNGLNTFHELVIISTEEELVKEARQYFKAFSEDLGKYPTETQTYSLSSALPQKTKSVFVNTSNGLNDLIHALLSSAKHSILLVSPHITNDVAELILNIIPREVQVHFVTWVDWRQWVNERSDPVALELFLSSRFKIESCPNLHANCIIVDDEAAIISSQSLTTDCWFSRDEAAIFTKNQELIADIRTRIDSWQPKNRLTLLGLEKEIESFDSFLAKETAPLPKLPEYEEHAMPHLETAESTSPPLMSAHSLSLTKQIPTQPSEPHKPILTPKLLAEPKWFEDIVYVGKKRLVEYVRACKHQVERKGSVTIKARGRLIYRAVDVAEQLKTIGELELILNEDSIKIETYYPTAKETKWGGISQIAITLHQKN